MYWNPVQWSHVTVAPQWTGGKALCMAGWCCIENIDLTRAMLRGVDHARPWWPPAPWDTYEVQRSANLWLCG